MSTERAFPIVLSGRYPFAIFSLVAGPLAIVLAAATYVLATTNSASVTIGAEIACASAGLPLIACLMAIATRAVNFRRPALTLTADGVQRTDLSLRWTDVAGVEVQRHFGRHYVALNVRDPEGFLGALPAYVAIAWASQFKRSKNCVLLPAVRELSTQQLCDLVEELRKEQMTAGQELADPQCTAYAPPTAKATATALAAGVFGFSLFFQWIGLIDCLRAGNIACLAGNAAAAVGAGAAVYVATLLVLRRVAKSRPAFDPWRLLAVPQVVIGGADPTLYDALGAPRVRREPYVVRLQKSPWRAVLYPALVSGCGLLACTLLLYLSMYFLAGGSRFVEFLARSRPMWLLILALVLVDFALVLIALLNLKIVSKGGPPPG